jgi:GTPase SAR1 family protein
MRLRSITLYNEEEFDNFFSNPTNISNNIIEENSEDDLNSNESDEFDELRCNSNYQLKEIPKTLKELEKIDEDNLFNLIEKMNKELNKLKNKKQKKIFYINFDNKKEKRSNSVNYYFNIDETNFNQNLNDSFISVHNENYSNLSLNSSTENSIDLNINDFDYDNFIMQNLKCFDEKIKLIVIGDEKVGKTLFLNKIGIYDNFKRKNNFNINEYNPTDCLEINKSYVIADKKLIKIESFDTNVKIINSKIIETYYNLCNGFIFVVSNDNINSINFIENQFKKILLNLNNLDKILFIVNEKIKDNFEFINKLKNLYIKYNHDNINKFNYLSIDLKNFNYSNIKFQTFLKNIISEKSCFDNESKFFNFTDDENIEKILSDRKEKIKEYMSENKYLVV